MRTLKVLIIEGQPGDTRLAARVLEDRGDKISVVKDVPDALLALHHEGFDAALIPLQLQRGDGLALVHHVRALHPEVDIVVTTGADEMSDAGHAMALGVLAHVVVPLTGDALLVALDRARERRLLAAERRRLRGLEATSERRRAALEQAARLLTKTQVSDVCRSLLELLNRELPSLAAALYVPSWIGSPQLTRTAALGEADSLPNTVDALKLAPELVALDEGRVCISFPGPNALSAVVLMVPEAFERLDDETRDVLETLATFGSSSLDAARRNEASARAGIKDPDTSAYTFAYFGDVAGREIDRAARHGRRFALLTLQLDGMEALSQQLAFDAVLQVRQAVADAMLGVVRDSDVLARVEDDEFFLLLPETGLLGALACRRRILSELAAIASVPERSLRPIVGIAIYPTDGQDLGRLLRMSRRRSEQARRSPWNRLELDRLPLWDAIATLLRDESAPSPPGLPPGALSQQATGEFVSDGSAQHGVIPISFLTRAAATIAADSARQGAGGVIYVSGSGELAAAVVSAVETVERRGLRTWVLGESVTVDGPYARFHLPVRDPMLERQPLLLALTDLGGYIAAARGSSAKSLHVYHAADLDLVDGLIARLQAAYHLQPELRG